MNRQEGQLYEFGPYRLIPAERLLLRDGEPVALTPKAFETLVALVERAGHLAEKDELLKVVWPDSFVEESNLAQNVFALRRALGESKKGKPYIETVPKRGYRFLASVRVIEDRGDAFLVRHHVRAAATQDSGQRTTTSPEHGSSIAPAEVETRDAAARTSLIAELVNRHKYGAAIVAGLLAVTLVVIGYGVVKLIGQRHRLPPLQSGKPVRLTTTGRATHVAISPDGKWVVHVMNDGGQRSLWTRQVATQSNVEIVAPAVVTYHSLTFSPDGNYVYYSVSSKDAPRLTLFQVATLGGVPKKILVDLNRDIDHAVHATVSFSPDGKQIAFLRQGVDKETSLTIANADGTSERTVTTYPPHEGIGYFTWSPDGLRIAYAVLDYRRNEMTVVEAPVTDGSRKPLTTQKWRRIFGLAWLSDGSGLLMLAGRDQFVCQIWQISYPSGEADQLTNDLNDYVGMSLAMGSNTLAVVKMEKQASVWLAPDNDASRARPITSGPEKADDQVASVPDGSRIVYRSNASGSSDIWIVGTEGGSPTQLTSEAGINVGPVVSPDGRDILFLSDRTGVPHIWKMKIDGTEQKQLTNGSGEELPQFSPDGRWIVYSTVGERSTVWKIPVAGGEPVQLTDKPSMSPTVSPDGERVACLYQDQNGAMQIAIIPFEGGPPLKMLDYGLPPSRIRWTPDGRAIAYVDPRDGVSNILTQPLDGGARKQLTDFKTDRTFSFDWSQEGRQLALARGTQASDVILIKYFR